MTIITRDPAGEVCVHRMETSAGKHKCDKCGGTRAGNKLFVYTRQSGSASEHLGRFCSLSCRSVWYQTRGQS